MAASWAMRLSAIFSICSSTTTELPSSVVSESGALAWVKRASGWFAAGMCRALVTVRPEPPPRPDHLGETVGDLQVAGAVAGRVGVGDVLGDHPLARVEPRELATDGGEQGNVVQAHCGHPYRLGRKCRPHG